MKIALSVVIITYNEARNIERCISSVRGLADEVLVLDSFSSDDTCALARAAGARVEQHAFDGHIQQKNRAAQMATYDYVLSLDADEALDDTLRASIAAVKENCLFPAYQMNRCTNYCGQWIKHSGWYPDRKLRLWDRRQGQWGGTNPHDKWELSDAGKAYGRLLGDILHYSYYSIEQHWQQAGKFSSIAAEAMWQQGKRISKPGIYFKAAFKFIRNYVLKAGFMDGYYGFIICRISAWETFQKYQKLWLLQQGKHK